MVLTELEVPMAIAGEAFVLATDKVSITMVGVRPAVDDPSRILVAVASPMVNAPAVVVSMMFVEIVFEAVELIYYRMIKNYVAYQVIDPVEEVAPAIQLKPV